MPLTTTTIILLFCAVGLIGVGGAYWEWLHEDDGGEMFFALFIAGVFFTGANAIYVLTKYMGVQ